MTKPSSRPPAPTDDELEPELLTEDGDDDDGVSLADLAAEAEACYLSREYAEALRLYVTLFSVDPDDRAAWHRVARLLRLTGDKKRAAAGLASLGRTHAEEGHLPLALLVAKELEEIDRVEGRKLMELLGRLYGSGSKRLAADSSGRAAPPTLPPEAREGRQTVSSTSLAADQIDEAADAALKQATARARPQSVLPTYPLFAALEASQASQLMALMKPREVEAGLEIITEGAQGDSIYVVARGEVMVSRRGTVVHELGAGPACRVGEPIELARLRPGAFFGEMALVSQLPRSATVTAAEPTTLLEASAEAIEKLAQKSATLASTLAGYCRTRLLQNLMVTSPLFRVLPPSARRAAIGEFESLVLEPDCLILTEGGSPDEMGLYLVASGGVEVLKNDQGELLSLARLGPGDVFGEISLLRQAPATATVKVLGRTVVLRLSRQAFDRLAAAHPQLLAHVYQLAGERERDQAELLGGEAISAEDLLI